MTLTSWRGRRCAVALAGDVFVLNGREYRWVWSGWVSRYLVFAVFTCGFVWRWRLTADPETSAWARWLRFREE